MPRTLTDLINEIPLHNLRFHDAETIISRDEAGRIAERLNAHPGVPVTVNTDRGPMQVVSSGPVTYGLDYMIEFCADPELGEFVQVILRSNPEEEFSVPRDELPPIRGTDLTEFERALEPIIMDYWQRRHGRRLDRCRLRGVGRSGYERRYIARAQRRSIDMSITIDPAQFQASLNDLSATAARAATGLREWGERQETPSDALRAEFEDIMQERMRLEAERLAQTAFIGEPPRVRPGRPERTYTHQSTAADWEPNKWEA